MSEPQLSWQESFQKLPPDVQARVQAWIGTQMFIARELGLEREAWFDYVAWAFRQPLDFSFMGQDGAEALAQLQDHVTSTADARRAAIAIGASPANPVVQGKAEPVDPSKARKAGLANIHMLGNMIDKTPKGDKKT